MLLASSATYANPRRKVMSTLAGSFLQLLPDWYTRHPRHPVVLEHEATNHEQATKYDASDLVQLLYKLIVACWEGNSYEPRDRPAHQLPSWHSLAALLNRQEQPRMFDSPDTVEVHDSHTTRKFGDCSTTWRGNHPKYKHCASCICEVEDSTAEHDTLRILQCKHKPQKCSPQNL
jgi:hypothetical protein